MKETKSGSRNEITLVTYQKLKRTGIHNYLNQSYHVEMPNIQETTDPGRFRETSRLQACRDPGTERRRGT